MKKMIMLTITMSLMLLVGCASCPSNGRITIVNWDSRDKDQLLAAQFTDGAVYGVQPQYVETGEARSFSAWAELFDMITKLKVQLQLFKIEWADSPVAKKPIAAKPANKKPEVKPGVPAMPVKK